MMAETQVRHVPGQLRFEPGSPQLAYLSIAAAQASTPPVMEPLPARITFDEDHTVRVFSPVAGRTQQIVAEPGQTVRAGDVLAWLLAPDYDAAERYYNEALRIDPKHRGALEYSGELYLMKGDLGKAEERLTTLDKVCTFSCAEYRDLKKSVEAYKKNGNKYVAADTTGSGW